MIENLTGVETLEYSLDAGRDGGITDPDYLRKVDAFAEWYRAQPEVAHVQVFTDIMKRLNKNMHGDDPAFYRCPKTPSSPRSTCLLYELSVPFGMDLNNRINVAKSRDAHDRHARQTEVRGAARARSARSGMAPRQRARPGERGIGGTASSSPTWPYETP